jgi:hypothetical protein
LVKSAKPLLEEAGVITGFTGQIDPAKVGMPLLVVIQMCCDQGLCLLRTSAAEEFREVLEMHKLSSSHCVLLKCVWQGHATAGGFVLSSFLKFGMTHVFVAVATYWWVCLQ